MKRFITYGSIEQFRSVVHNVQHQAQCVGYCEDKQEPIMNRSVVLPVIKVIGSEKIHGTNASVCYSNKDGFWVQSRKNIITPEKDNASCAFQTYAREKEWMEIIHSLAKEHNIDLDTHIISVYFEWSGGNIQKLSALTGLDKRAMIFQYFKVSPLEPQTNDGVEQTAKWLTTGNVDNTECNIYNIMNFPTVELEIDFNHHLLSQNKMLEMVATLEKDSLVGKQMGIDGNVGEGYVFTFEYNDKVYRFKVKGEKHAGKSKIKTLKPVDEEFENVKIKFVNEVACISWRLDQMFNEIQSETEGILTTKQTGDFLRKVIVDVIKEESDIMIELGIEPKIINGQISKVAKNYFFDRLDNDEVGGN